MPSRMNFQGKDSCLQKNIIGVLNRFAKTETVHKGKLSRRAGVFGRLLKTWETQWERIQEHQCGDYLFKWTLKSALVTNPWRQNWITKLPQQIVSPEQLVWEKFKQEWFDEHSECTHNDKRTDGRKEETYFSGRKNILKSGSIYLGAIQATRIVSELTGIPFLVIQCNVTGKIKTSTVAVKVDYNLREDLY